MMDVLCTTFLKDIAIGNPDSFFEGDEDGGQWPHLALNV
jgi:hypothetical protein